MEEDNSDKNEEKRSTILSGVSGEYFVAAELSKRGNIASITLRNTKGVDILCSNSEATKTVGIQVKTNSGSSRNWILNQKADLNENKKHPEFFIVPSKIVAQYCKEGHSNWLSTPSKKGQKHKDTPMRKFHDTNEEYLNRWDLLNL